MVLPSIFKVVSKYPIIVSNQSGLLIYVREGLLTKETLLSILCGNDTRFCLLIMQYHFQPSVGSFVIVSILGSVAMPK